jgi:hypothetical protein
VKEEMGACAAQVFNGITREKFTCLQQKAAEQGISIDGDQGVTSKDSVTAQWDFDEENQTLTIQCTSSPFFLTCGKINSTIHDFVDSCS